MEIKPLFIVVLLFILGYASGLRWKECGTKAVTAVSVTGCEKTDVCTLKRGTKVVFAVQFKAAKGGAKATTVVHGLLGPIPVPFPVKQPNACIGSGITCPVKAGTTYNYKNTIEVKTSYPAVKVLVKWEVQNEKEEDYFCIVVPVKIV